MKRAALAVMNDFRFLQPFEHEQGDPAERVLVQEHCASDRIDLFFPRLDLNTGRRFFCRWMGVPSRQQLAAFETDSPRVIPVGRTRPAAHEAKVNLLRVPVLDDAHLMSWCSHITCWTYHPLGGAFALRWDLQTQPSCLCQCVAMRLHIAHRPTASGCRLPNGGFWQVGPTTCWSRRDSRLRFSVTLDMLQAQGSRCSARC